jgi:cytochrome b involved in lipid metabolism
MIINGKVYDITSFLEDHPGGEEVLTELAGQDGTDPFDEIGHSPDAVELLKKFYVGDVEGAVQKPVEKKQNIKYPSSQGSSTNYFLIAAIPVVLVLGYAYYKFYAS